MSKSYSTGTHKYESNPHRFRDISKEQRSPQDQDEERRNYKHSERENRERRNRKRKNRFSDKSTVDSSNIQEKHKRNKWDETDEGKPENDKLSKPRESQLQTSNSAISLIKATPELKTNQLRDKIYFPQDGVNYIGLLIGPKGMFQKKLENDTGCRILIRGRGSRKENQPRQPDDDDDQHVVVVADTKEILQRGIEECTKIIFADAKTKERIRHEQLKVGAELSNPTLGNHGAPLPMDESMMTLNGPPSPTAYIMPVPDGCTGLIIGKKGDKIKTLQWDTGAKIQVAKAKKRDTDERYIFIEGSNEQYYKVKQLIEDIIDDWKLVNKQKMLFNVRNHDGPFQVVSIPENIVPFLMEPNADKRSSNNPIGMNYLQSIYEKHVVRIYVPPECDPHTGQRNIEVSGKSKNVSKAIAEIYEFMKHNSADPNSYPPTYNNYAPYQQQAPNPYAGQYPQGYQNHHYANPYPNSYPPSNPYDAYNQGYSQQQYNYGYQQDQSHQQYPEQTAYSYSVKEPYSYSSQVMQESSQTSVTGLRPIVKTEETTTPSLGQTEASTSPVPEPSEELKKPIPESTTIPETPPVAAPTSAPNPTLPNPIPPENNTPSVETVEEPKPCGMAAKKMSEGVEPEPLNMNAHNYASYYYTVLNIPYAYSYDYYIKKYMREEAD